MGAIRNVVNQIDGTDEATETQKELIKTLSELAETKADKYIAETTKEFLEAGTKGNQTIPIKKILKNKKYIHAITSDCSDNISTTVNTALKSFVTGGKDNIVSGIGDLVTTAVTAFLGNASATTDEMNEYYVMTEGLSIVRIDLYGWSLNVEAKAIKEKMQQVSAFVGFKSAVDISNLDYNSFIDIYKDQLSNTNTHNTDDIIKELEDAQKIFDKLKALEINSPQVAQLSR